MTLNKPGSRALSPTDTPPQGPDRAGITIHEYRDALEAAREALDIPHGASVGDQCIRDAILMERVMHMAGTLERILGDDPYLDIPWQVAYLRARLAEHPAQGYKTWDERVAEMDAARGGGR